MNLKTGVGITVLKDGGNIEESLSIAVFRL
jgi:hypothetical protein